MIQKRIFLTVLLVSLLTLMQNVSIGQIPQPYRYEREHKTSEDYFHIISLKEKGLALFRERDKFRQSNRIWELIFLDSTLREEKVLELEIKERFKMVGYEVTPENLYFLFRTGETTKNDFVLIEISDDGRELARYPVKPDLDFRLTHFVKVGQNFVFGGYVSNEAVIILFDPAANSLKVVPGFFQKDTELVDLRTNQNQTFNTILMDRSTRGERKLVFKTFDETGKQLLEDNIQVDDDINLQTGIASTLEREELMIAGTWGERNSKQSNGFYTLSVDPFNEQKIQYVDFGKLEHFVDYLNPKRAARVKEASKESASSGKTPAFSSYVMPFRMVETKDGFHILAEVYNPVNTSSMQNTNPYYYNPYFSPYGYNPFWPGFYYPGMSRMYRPYFYGPNPRTSDEIKSLETVVFSFDEKGKVKWDQSFKLEEIKLPALEQVGDFAVIDQEVVILYKKESELKLKTATLGGDQIREASEKIKTKNEQDLIRSEKETEGGVRHWYGNSFYVWGYQTIRNTTQDVRVRDVFYINRVDP